MPVQWFFISTKILRSPHDVEQNILRALGQFFSLSILPHSNLRIVFLNDTCLEASASSAVQAKIRADRSLLNDRLLRRFYVLRWAKSNPQWRH